MLNHHFFIFHFHFIKLSGKLFLSLYEIYGSLMEKIMIEQNHIMHLTLVFRKVFSLPITRTTFRELQSALMGVSQGDRELFTDITESLLAGQIKPILKGKVDLEVFQRFIEQFHIQVLVSKEVHDKAEFITFITSDVINQPQGVIFSNCIKTVNGKEHRFFTDVESTLQLIQHFIGRIHEAKGIETSKEQFDKLSERINDLRRSVDLLVE